jgi:hypothetical protein
MLNQLTDWVKKNKLLALGLLVAAALLLAKRSREPGASLAVPVENFSTCFQRRQIYLNSCDTDEPTGMGDVNIEKRWGKMYISINANLPYARGGVFHTMYGAYHAFAIDPRNKRSINLGTLVRHGDRMYKLATELLGDYSDYTEIVIYRQTEDYAPKMVLKGSITGQQCTSL